MTIVDDWRGFFMFEKTTVAFFPVPFPSRSEQQRIQDAFFDKRPTGDGQASDPLTVEALEAQKGNLLEDNYNWFFLWLWFELLPHEINGLKGPKTWKASVNKKSRKLLHAYQQKLIKIPRPKRWKVIPIKHKRQEATLTLIEAKK